MPPYVTHTANIVDDSTTSSSSSTMRTTKRSRLSTRTRAHTLPLADPIPFPRAHIGRATSNTNTSNLDKQKDPVLVYNPQDGSVHKAYHVVVSHDTGKAYWLRKTLRRAIYGGVCHGFVLRLNDNDNDDDANYNKKIQFIMTGEQCAVKCMDWAKVLENDLKHIRSEDPLKEVAAMQYLQNNSNVVNNDNYDCGCEHVMTPMEVICDGRTLFLMMPYMGDGEMFDRLKQAGDRFQEGEARYFMRQIIAGVQSMHRAGVCHRDISLENILLDGGFCKIIDFGMCLKAPKGRYMKPQGVCGKGFYMSPEVYKNVHGLDGFASDMWSVGVLLFMMMIGSAPFERPDYSDDCFSWIVGGRLEKLLKTWQTPVSREGIDLINRLLCVNPQDRLTAEEILSHPWFSNFEDDEDVPAPPMTQCTCM